MNHDAACFLVLADIDRDAIVRCSPPGNGYTPSSLVPEVASLPDSSLRWESNETHSRCPQKYNLELTKGGVRRIRAQIGQWDVTLRLIRLLTNVAYTGLYR